jgi:hypothetical protein
MKRQLDLYAECNLGQAPEHMFKEQCCVKCVNPECSRSMYGRNHFDERVSNWRERLFTDVPRMVPDDPRYGKIAGQKFLLIDPAGSTGSSDWVDPRDLERKPQIQVPVQVISTPEPTSPSEPAPEPTTSGHAPPHATALNTQVQRGQMLPHKKQDAPAKWDGPIHPAQPPAQVVKSGAKIKLGGG